MPYIQQYFATLDPSIPSFPPFSFSFLLQCFSLDVSQISISSWTSPPDYILNCLADISTSIANRHFKQHMSKADHLAISWMGFLLISINCTSIHPSYLTTNQEVVLDFPLRLTSHSLSASTDNKTSIHFFSFSTTLVQPLSSLTSATTLVSSLVSLLLLLPPNNKPFSM